MSAIRSHWLRDIFRLFGLFLASFCLFTLPAHGQVVIDFESLSAPGSGTGGLLVKNQFAGQGLIFKGVTALDYSQGIPIPNFTHSGTKAVELCYAAEFCTGPLDFSFTTPQRSVKLWVGFTSPLDSAQTVVMRAYDILGNQLGHTTATIGPSTGVIPVNTPLQIGLPVLPRIDRVTVGFLGAEGATPTMFNNGLVVDDIQFTSAGQPPTCPATQPPGIGLIAPTDGEIVVTNSFTVEANLTTPDPFATLQVSASSGGQTHTFGPVFVTSGHVVFAGLTGMLFPGANNVVITVKDCFGLNDRTLTVNYRNDVTSTSILVIDDDRRVVPGAEVYANGVLLGRSDQFGQLKTSPALGDGTTLVARRFITESTTYRGNHAQGSFQNWKFRVYTSNVAVENDGSLTMKKVKLEPNPLALQVIQVLKKNTLMGLHVVASLEWDASAADIEAVKQKLIGASKFLYNATDGQILFEHADIVDNGTFWEDADYRVYANQHLRENVDCPVGAFFDDSFWCNGSWVHVQVNSDGPTYAHEFGHYGFGLGDEYQDNHPEVKCTHQLDVAGGQFSSHAPAASCMMNDQWEAPKLCSGRSENPHVHDTDQGDDSCWSDLIDKFKDDNDNPRWQLQSPDTRQFIPGTINGTNPPLSAWSPVFTVQNSAHDNLCAPVGVHFSFSDGTPAVGEDVWLHTTYGADILQGKSNLHGDLTAVGVHLGDNLQDFVVQSTDCSPTAAARRESPGNTPGVLLVAQKTPQPQKPVTPPLRRGERVAPHQIVVHPANFRLRVSMTPGKADRTAELSVWAENLKGARIALKQPPVIKVKLVGHRDELKAPLHPAAQANGHAATLVQLPLDVEISVEITGMDALGHTERSIARFEMNRPDPGKKSKIFSADGQLQLTLPPQALPRGARVSIGPATSSLPPLANGEVFAVEPFRVASDSGDKLALPATLEFRLPHTLHRSGATDYDAGSFVVAVYDAATGKWTREQAVFHPFPIDTISLRTANLGTFALVAHSKGKSE